jgi:hypothetical protein
MIVNPGFFHSSRTPYRTSCQNVCIEPPPLLEQPEFTSAFFRAFFGPRNSYSSRSRHSERGLLSEDLPLSHVPFSIVELAILSMTTPFIHSTTIRDYNQTVSCLLGAVF